MNSEVEKIIIENSLSKNKTLNLVGFSLDEIPRSVFDLIHLKELKLSYNNIKVIPSDISKLKNLTHLYLYNNKISNLNKVFFKKMGLLVHIDIAENPIYSNLEIIKEILNNCSKYRGTLEFEQKLLSMNPDETTRVSFWKEIYEIPDVLFNFKKLETLSLCISRKLISRDEFDVFKELRYLSFSGGGRLEKLPNSIYRLPKLEIIHLDNNNFLDFPDKLLTMNSLYSISLNFNKIKKAKSIITEMAYNKKIKHFSLGGNPLEDFNESLFQGGIDYIREYYYDIAV